MYLKYKNKFRDQIVEVEEEIETHVFYKSDVPQVMLGEDLKPHPSGRKIYDFGKPKEVFNKIYKPIK